ncbi:MAG: TetR family transcriptional regulator [Actinobacteria bacterium]|nr:TetR family transcriptional regulator [Actinomycetota bacterium]
MDSADVGRAAGAAARAVLARAGYADTTLKAVASAAGIAPDVLASLYRNREELLRAALQLPFDPTSAVPRLVGPGLDGMGERLVRAALAVMESDQMRSDIAYVGRAASGGLGSAGGSVDVVGLVRGAFDFVQDTVVDRALESLGVPDARMRGALITSYLAGVMSTRYVVKMEPLASASDDEVVALVAPLIQRTLDPRNPLREA